MALTVDTRRIKNHKEVCYEAETKDGFPYKPTTHYLAWGSMAIGIGEITENNYHEVYFRHKFINQISSWNKSPLSVTLKDVYQHIGLETNVGNPEPRGKWKNRIVKNAMVELSYNISQEEKETMQAD